MPIQIQMIPIVPSKGFGDVGNLGNALKDAVRDQAAEGVRLMSNYPGKPPQSTYRRTGTLRRSWSFVVRSASGGIEGTIGSSSAIAPYNRPVQGEDQQALFKAIGWKSVDDLVKMVNREFASRVQRVIDREFA